VANQVKISQLDALQDSEVNKDIYFPVVYESDPLNRNRRLTVGQIFFGIDSGSKTSPGLKFSGVVKTGVYRKSVNNVENVGLSFGNQGIEFFGTGTSSVTIAPIIENQTLYDLIFKTPNGGKVRFESGTTLQTLDNAFNIQKSSDSRINAKLDLDLITTEGNVTITKTYRLPSIVSSVDTLVSLTSTQTLTNKRIEIDDNNLIVSSKVKDNPTQFKGRFTFAVNISQPLRTDPFEFILPKTNSSDNFSEIIDDRTEGQSIRSKRILVGGSGVNNIFSTDVSGNVNFRISLPNVNNNGSWALESDSRNFNLDLTDNDFFVGTKSIQNIINKKFGNISISRYNSLDASLQENAVNIIGIDLPTAAAYLTFPTVSQGISTDVNVPSVITTTTATQTLSNKTIVNPIISNNIDFARTITFDFSELTDGSSVTLKLPSSNITLFGLDVDGDLNLGSGRYVEPVFVNNAKTRKVTFDLSLLSANRIQKLPNKSGTLQISDADDDVILTGKLVNPTITNSNKDKSFTFDFTNSSASSSYKVPKSTSGTFALIDSTNQLFFDDIVNDKRVNFNLSKLTNNSTRTISIPDASITILGIDETENLTTIDSDLKVNGSLETERLSGQYKLKTYFYSVWSS
jgi:hypothetical protein